MAALSSPSDQVAGALENLSIGSQTMTTETPSFPKKDIYGNTDSTMPTLGNNGQLYGTQNYQYPAPFYQAVASTGTRSPNPGTASKASLSAGTAAGNSSNTLTNGSANKINRPKPFKPDNKNSSSSFNSPYNKGSRYSSNYYDSRYGYDGYQSPFPWIDPSMYTNELHALNAGYSSRPNSHPTRPMYGLGQTMMYPYNRAYSQYGYRGGSGYGSNSWENLGWVVVDNKYTTKGRVFGNGNAEGLSELNRGPRGKEPNLASKESSKEEKTAEMPDKENYNKEDFPEDYSNAKFFVIKSYSEDDVHKSIKYGVWASTPNGNKKLDEAYGHATENSTQCPVFLLFSVNTSGQFVGLAEMTGPVDFNKTVDYWQQEKWIGCFPVKWHIIKDVPNSSLRHITLENNENKPVTNSRDTQEVILEKGLEILKIFKGYKGKTSILDDFGFYAARERIMQEKRAKLKTQKQVSDGNKNVVMDSEKSVEKDGSELGVEKSASNADSVEKKGAQVVASAC